MPDFEEIRKRNEAFERELAHDCDPDPVEVQRCADTRDLLTEVGRLRHKAGECACDSRASQYGWDDVQCVWKVRDNEKKLRSYVKSV